MTLAELNLVLFGLNQTQYTEAKASAIRIIEREIRLKTMDPRYGKPEDSDKEKSRS